MRKLQCIYAIHIPKQEKKKRVRDEQKDSTNLCISDREERKQTEL